MIMQPKKKHITLVEMALNYVNALNIEYKKLYKRLDVEYIKVLVD
jgi:hypothetical protein